MAKLVLWFTFPSTYCKCIARRGETRAILISVSRLWLLFCKQGKRAGLDQVHDPETVGDMAEWSKVQERKGRTHLRPEHVSCLRNLVELSGVITAWGHLSLLHSVSAEWSRLLLDQCGLGQHTSTNVLPEEFWLKCFISKNGSLGLVFGVMS